MGWLDPLRGSVVGIDTMVFIYYLEKNVTYLPVVRPFFNALDTGAFRAVTSIASLLEALVLPFRYGNTILIESYSDILFSATGLAPISLERHIAVEAAQLRAAYPTLRTPDAIQIATALYARASFFLTNDARLASKVPSSLQLLVLEDLLAAGIP